MGDKIRILPLGGLDEIGKECTVVEINGDIFVVNCGLRYPDRTMPGIDYVIPRSDYLVENKDRIRGYFLLHGHDDVTGGLAYIYKDAPATIYGSRATVTMFKIFTSHIGADPKQYKFQVVPASGEFSVAGRKMVFFHTAHNIADSSGLAIPTSYGNIVFTGDYVVENAAQPSYLHDMNAIAKLAETPTLALLSESVYADKPGYTAPRYKLTPLVEESFKNATGRIFVSIFSDNFYNIDEIIKLAKATRRKIIPYDATTKSIWEAMVESGHLIVPKENIASMDDVLRFRDADLIILICGFGARLFNKIAILASGNQEDKRIKLKPEDTFIVASPSDDYTSIEATDAVDELYRSGCHVTHINGKKLLDMHASEEDLKMMISLLKPKYYIPVNGFYKELLKNAQVALSMGLNLSHQNVFLLENGTSLLIDEKGARLVDEDIPHGDIMIDGIGVGDVTAKAIEDRQKLSDGVVVLAVTLSKKRKKIIAGPDVQMRGFVFNKDADSLLKETGRMFVSTINDFLKDGPYNIDEIKQNVYEKCLRNIRRQTGKEPMVLPLIIEVE
ncbi:MAG: ribonuclease J [Bacillota bacterium]|nr:ribonuclease J [Bacillota bacterium]